MTDASGREVLVEDMDGVRLITLNRPDRLNALVPTIMAELAEAVGDAAEASSVGCVVLTGAGRGFCAGGDIRQEPPRITIDAERGTRVEQGFDRLRGFAEAARLLHDMTKPTIAMVNGPVAGAGIGLACACDLRFAARSATFLSGYDRIGASGDFGATWFVTKILGTAGAREVFLLGEKLEAEAAFAKGLYTRLYLDEQLRDETLKAARRLAGGSRVGWRYMKANLNFAQDHDLGSSLDQETLHMGLSVTATALIRREQAKSGDL